MKRLIYSFVSALMLLTSGAAGANETSILKCGPHKTNGSKGYKREVQFQSGADSIKGTHFQNKKFGNVIWQLDTTGPLPALVGKPEKGKWIFRIEPFFDSYEGGVFNAKGDQSRDCTLTLASSINDKFYEIWGQKENREANNVPTTSKKKIAGALKKTDQALAQIEKQKPSNKPKPAPTSESKEFGAPESKEFGDPEPNKPKVIQKNVKSSNSPTTAAVNAKKTKQAADINKKPQKPPPKPTTLSVASIKKIDAFLKKNLQQPSNLWNPIAIGESRSQIQRYMRTLKRFPYCKRPGAGCGQFLDIETDGYTGNYFMDLHARSVRFTYRESPSGTYFDFWTQTSIHELHDDDDEIKKMSAEEVRLLKEKITNLMVSNLSKLYGQPKTQKIHDGPVEFGSEYIWKFNGYNIRGMFFRYGQKYPNGSDFWWVSIENEQKGQQLSKKQKSNQQHGLITDYNDISYGVSYGYGGNCDTNCVDDNLAELLCKNASLFSKNIRRKAAERVDAHGSEYEFWEQVASFKPFNYWKYSNCILDFELTGTYFGTPQFGNFRMKVESFVVQEEFQRVMVNGDRVWKMPWVYKD